MAGSMAALGIGPSPEMTSALCGVPSLLLKLITMFALDGTARVAPPLVYPLKLNGPAVSSKVTVLLAASYLRGCPWLLGCAGAAAGVESRAGVVTARGTVIGLEVFRPGSIDG